MKEKDAQRNTYDILFEGPQFSQNATKGEEKKEN